MGALRSSCLCQTDDDCQLLTGRTSLCCRRPCTTHRQDKGPRNFVLLLRNHFRCFDASKFRDDGLMDPFCYCSRTKLAAATMKYHIINFTLRHNHGKNWHTVNWPSDSELPPPPSHFPTATPFRVGHTVPLDWVRVQRRDRGDYISLFRGPASSCAVMWSHVGLRPPPPTRSSFRHPHELSKEIQFTRLDLFVPDRFQW